VWDAPVIGADTLLTPAIDSLQYQGPRSQISDHHTLCHDVAELSVRGLLRGSGPGKESRELGDSLLSFDLVVPPLQFYQF